MVERATSHIVDNNKDVGVSRTLYVYPHTSHFTRAAAEVCLHSFKHDLCTYDMVPVHSQGMNNSMPLADSEAVAYKSNKMGA